MKLFPNCVTILLLLGFFHHHQLLALTTLLNVSYQNLHIMDQLSADLPFLSVEVFFIYIFLYFLYLLYRDAENIVY